MKTYKDLATIETINTHMELKKFWSIIEHCQTQTTPELRDYDLLKSLAKLSIDEIISFALRIQALALELLSNEGWRSKYNEELKESADFFIEDITLWAIFQGQEFYETSLQTPMFLIKRIDAFKATAIPESKVITHALGLKIAEEYIRFEDFIPNELREKLIW